MATAIYVAASTTAPSTSACPTASSTSYSSSSFSSSRVTGLCAPSTSTIACTTPSWSSTSNTRLHYASCPPGGLASGSCRQTYALPLAKDLGTEHAHRGGIDDVAVARVRGERRGDAGEGNSSGVALGQANVLRAVKPLAHVLHFHTAVVHHDQARNAGSREELGDPRAEAAETHHRDGGGGEGERGGEISRRM